MGKRHVKKKRRRTEYHKKENGKGIESIGKEGEEGGEGSERIGRRREDYLKGRKDDL